MTKMLNLYCSLEGARFAVGGPTEGMNSVRQVVLLLDREKRLPQLVFVATRSSGSVVARNPAAIFTHQRSRDENLLRRWGRTCRARRSRRPCSPPTSPIWRRRPSSFRNAAQTGCTWTSWHYVPNLTIGAPVIKSLRKHTKMFMDCHLMVTNPMDYVDEFVKAGASGFTFHVEVSKDNWQELVHKIKAAGMRAGVALRPGTPIEEVFPLVESEEPVDMVLVMTVEPGFGGQSFMPETMPKVNALRRKFPHLDIEVDGGLSPATIKQAAEAGANCIVAGSAVFGAKDPAEVIAALRKGVDDAQASMVFFK